MSEEVLFRNMAAHSESHHPDDSDMQRRVEADWSYYYRVRFIFVFLLFRINEFSGT